MIQQEATKRRTHSNLPVEVSVHEGHVDKAQRMSQRKKTNKTMQAEGGAQVDPQIRLCCARRFCMCGVVAGPEMNCPS